MTKRLQRKKQGCMRKRTPEERLEGWHVTMGCDFLGSVSAGTPTPIYDGIHHFYFIFGGCVSYSWYFLILPRFIKGVGGRDTKWCLTTRGVLVGNMIGPLAGWPSCCFVLKRDRPYERGRTIVIYKASFLRVTVRFPLSPFLPGLMFRSHSPACDETPHAMPK